MTGAPVFLDDRLVGGWIAALRRRNNRIPASLLDTWQRALLAAVQEAREPAPMGVAGRFAPLDRYLTGVAAGIAAGLGTSPASDGGDSDPIILAAGLLAGSAALQASRGIEPFEVIAGRAAAAAVVDAAADGGGLVLVIRAAARAAEGVRRHALVSIALAALARSVTNDPADQDRDAFEVSLILEPVDPGDDLDTIALDQAIEGLSSDCLWIPVDTGYRLVLASDEPGALIETVWSFGRVRELRIRHLPA